MDIILRIPIKTLAELIRNDWKLSALEAAGVDNWSWYGEALSEKDDDGLDWWDIQDMDDVELVKSYGYEVIDNT